MNRDLCTEAILNDDLVMEELTELLQAARDGDQLEQDILYDYICTEVPHCEKGACLTPATRLANYLYKDGSVMRCGTYGLPEGEYGSGLEVCDRHYHGRPVVKELRWAEVLREACVFLRERGQELWWDEYSGALDAPKSIEEKLP